MGLFSPLALRGVTVPNRVVVSPMSQYAAAAGVANDWHFAHLARFALGGASLVFCEATAIEERGRRTPGDLGLWHDGQIEPLARINRFLEEHGAVPGVQLAHAGRKGSERRPWHGETPLDDEDLRLRGERAWPTIGPSEEPYAEGWHRPAAMTPTDIETVKTHFRNAAQRSLHAGFKVIEVYAAHGFLLHQFYSPIANRRDDPYGGDLSGRMRLSLEVADAIRSVWPETLPLFFRLSVTDWVDGGFEPPEAVELARALGERGVDLIDCSSGGIGGTEVPRRMPLGPAFQAPLAEQIRRDAGIATMSVGFIWDAHVADAIIRDGRADLVAMARELLYNPNWPLQAAAALGQDEGFARWNPRFGWWLGKRDRVLRKLGLR